MAALPDWFWAHPLSLERYAAAPEGSILCSDREEQPEALAEKSYVNLFLLPNRMKTLRVESGSGADAWELVQSLSGKNG